LQVPPGGTDTKPHKHSCELVGNALEGEIETKMGNEAAKKYKSGEVFYEYPYQLHESIRNVNPDKVARILLFYVLTTGTKVYIPYEVHTQH